MPRCFRILLGLGLVGLGGRLNLMSDLEAKVFYHQHDQGWFWYQQPPTPPQTPQPKAEASSALPKALSAQDHLKQIQESLEEATARAILHPTLLHVQEVMTLQRQILNRASQFQEVWMQASLFEGQHQRPEDNPTPVARQLMKADQETNLNQKLRQLAQQTGLFFVFDTSCSHCHAFAPLLKQFAQEHGFEVKAISKQGEALKEFPNTVKDNGIIARLNPQGVYPALFLAHPPTGQVIPVAWGLTTPTQLRDNFATVLKALEEKTFHAR